MQHFCQNLLRIVAAGRKRWPRNYHRRFNSMLNICLKEKLSKKKCFQKKNIQRLKTKPFRYSNSKQKQSFEDAEKKKKEDEGEEGKSDPLTQLVTTFCRGAMTERSGALQEDPLYMSYAQIAAKSCGEEEEDEGGGEGEEGASIHVIIQLISV